jgi:hypothetical protein
MKKIIVIYLVCSAYISAADTSFLTNVLLEVSDETVSPIVKCIVENAIQQNFPDHKLEEIRSSYIDGLVTTDVKKIANIRYIASNLRSGALQIYKIQLASLDPDLGWYEVPDSLGKYHPFTPLAAVVASLENESTGKIYGLFDINSCK